MVFTEPPQALQFRIELNKNYMYEFLNKTSHNCQSIDVQRLTELVEDRLNMIDILKNATIKVHTVIRQVLHEQKTKSQRNYLVLHSR